MYIVHSNAEEKRVRRSLDIAVHSLEAAGVRREKE